MNRQPVPFRVVPYIFMMAVATSTLTNTIVF